MLALISLLLELVRLFIKSPPARRQAIMARVRGAFDQADHDDDTSAVEDLVNH